MSCPTQHVVTPCHTMLWHVLSYTCVAVCCSELQMSSWHSYETCVGQDMSQHVVTPVDSHIRDIRMCDMSHVRMSHVTHINESCHTYEWVMSHIWRIRDTHMKESCYMYEGVTTYHNMYEGVTNSCHVTCMKETRTHVMLHVWRSHDMSQHVVTPRSVLQCVVVSCRWVRDISMWAIRLRSHDMSQHVTPINPSCHMCDMLTCVTHMNELCRTYGWVYWLLHTCHTYKSGMSHDGLIRVCVMPYIDLYIRKRALYIRKRALYIRKIALYIHQRALYMSSKTIWAIRLIRMCNSVLQYVAVCCGELQMSSWHSYERYDSFVCVTVCCSVLQCVVVSCRWVRDIHMSDTTHSYVWHASFVCMTWLLHRCDVTIHMYDMTHSYVWHDSFICVTWLIHIFAKEPCIFAKEPCISAKIFCKSDVTIHMYDMIHSLVGVTWLTHS